MDRRMDQVQITNYVLNEMKPEERLFVEAMMLGCEKTRADALAMMEVARMLEEGMDAELGGAVCQLDPVRREKILSFQRPSFWEWLGRASATAVSLAACVAFSVAAPVISRLALNTEASKSQSSARSSGDARPEWSSDVIDPGAFPSVVVDAPESLSGSPTVEEFPTRILLPTGAVNFVEMPMPSLGGDLN